MIQEYIEEKYGLQVYTSYILKQNDIHKIHSIDGLTFRTPAQRFCKRIRFPASYEQSRLPAKLVVYCS